MRTHTITALARCCQCSARWDEADAIEAAQRHAQQLAHHVKGARHEVLDDDQRPDDKRGPIG